MSRKMNWDRVNRENRAWRNANSSTASPKRSSSKPVSAEAEERRVRRRLKRHRRKAREAEARRLADVGQVVLAVTQVESLITIPVRLPRSLQTRLKAAAERECRSVNNLLVLIVEDWVNRNDG
jgi:hypothetical protein